MATLSPPPKLQFFDAAGVPLVGGKLYSYQAGTTTPLATYTSQNGVTPNTNPIILDSRGEANVWLGAASYKLALYTATDVLVWTVDGIDNVDSGDGFATLAQLAASGGSSLIGYLPAGTGAVATTVQTKLRESVSVFDFMTAAQVADVQTRTAAIDVSTALQAAVTAAWKAGKRCYMPAGKYRGRITIPYYDGVNTYQGDAFELYGDGAANGFLGGSPFDKGTTLVAPDTTGVTLRYLNSLGAGTTSGNHIYIRGIRFEHTSVNPVVQFDRFSDYSVFERCEIRQHGTGAGLRCLHAYGGTIANIHSMNDDLVAPAGTVRTSIAFDIQTAAGLSGGLLCIDKCTGRGFQTALSLGGASDGVVSTRITQFEGSTVTYGVIVNAAMNGTVIDTAYFEGVDNTCIQDQGRSTKVLNSFFFENYLYGIDNRYSNYGNVYSGNHFHLDSANCIAIAVLSNGDATGTKKFIDNNFFFFLGSGGALAGVVGINITGANPKVEMGVNSFRPNRIWVGGAGTAQIVDSSTGRLSGSVVTADTLNSFPLYSNVGLSLAYTGNTLTQADVVANVLTLPVESDIEINASSAASVTSIALGSGRDRVVVLNLSNANMTLTRGALMKLSANFAPATGGTITLMLRTAAGVTTAYELARTTF